MEEIIELRTENTKTFNISNGEYRLESYIGAIHYKNDYATAEAWKDIDLTWVGNQILKAPYELTRDGDKVTFKNKKTGEVSTIERTSIFPSGIPFEVAPELSAVRFRHILPSTNIPFEAQFKITGKAPITRAFDDAGELELETILIGDILTEKLSQVRDKQTGQIRPAKGKIRIDPTWQVGVSSDDLLRRLTTSYFSLTYTTFAVGRVDVNLRGYGGGMRFTNITIPQWSVIDSAYLTLRAGPSQGAGTSVFCRISAEDVDDPATFADDAAAFDTRWAARTTARVDWDNIAAWTADTDYNSPSIVSVIQEIVDRAGWASGNDIVIFWEDFEYRTTVDDNHRGAYCYDGSTTYAPKLVVTYTVPTAYVRNFRIYEETPIPGVVVTD